MKLNYIFEHKRIWRSILVVVLSLALTAFCIHLFRRANAKEYQTFSSPDGRYKVVVYRIPSFVISPSGAGGEAPGYVRLLDKSGRVLEEADVKMVQDIDWVDWKDKHVSLSGGIDWRLPD